MSDHKGFSIYNESGPFWPRFIINACIRIALVKTFQ